MSLHLTERQFFMLKDVSSFNFKKYPYQAMPEIEVETRDFRTMGILLRRGLVEHPMTYDHNSGLPRIASTGIRITPKGIEALKQYRK